MKPECLFIAGMVDDDPVCIETTIPVSLATDITGSQ